MEDDKVAELKELLPKPAGYRLLIAMPGAQEKVGNIYMPDDLRDREKTASIYGNVIAVGPDAYKDQTKFPNGPWCQEGDWVIFRSYSGTRFKVKGQEFRLINDDTVEGVAEDPRNIERAFG